MNRRSALQLLASSPILGLPLQVQAQETKHDGLPIVRFNEYEQIINMEEVMKGCEWKESTHQERYYREWTRCNRVWVEEKNRKTYQFHDSKTYMWGIFNFYQYIMVGGEYYKNGAMRGYLEPTPETNRLEIDYNKYGLWPQEYRQKMIAEFLNAKKINT